MAQHPVPALHAGHVGEGAGRKRGPGFHCFPFLFPPFEGLEFHMSAALPFLCITKSFITPNAVGRSERSEIVLPRARLVVSGDLFGRNQPRFGFSQRKLQG